MASISTWVIEPAHTHIGFSVRHLGLTNTWGLFKRFDARVHFDEANVEASSVIFEVDTASIDTGLELRDGHLRGADWFDVQAYPKAIFASRSVQSVGHNRYLVVGDLSLRGQTWPVEFDALLTGTAVNPWTQADLVGFALTGAISRSAYGMGAFPAALSDEVQLRVELELGRNNEVHQKND